MSLDIQRVPQRLVTSRRQALLGLAASALWLGGMPGAALAASNALPSTASLPASLDKALQTKQPLVVMVSLAGCPFCKVVREHHLLPLSREGLPVVQLDMRDARNVVDFDGSTLTQDAWVRQHSVKIAPTVLFFGPHGREVAKRLTGAYLPDFYGAYLDEQLSQAQRAVHGVT